MYLATFSCLVEPSTGGRWRVNSNGFVDQVYFMVAGPQRLRYSIKGAPGNQAFRCDVIGTHAIEAGPYTGSLPYPFDIDLISTGRGRFTYIDVIGP